MMLSMSFTSQDLFIEPEVVAHGGGGEVAVGEVLVVQVVVLVSCVRMQEVSHQPELVSGLDRLWSALHKRKFSGEKLMLNLSRMTDMVHCVRSVVTGRTVLVL